MINFTRAFTRQRINGFLRNKTNTVIDIAKLFSCFSYFYFATCRVNVIINNWTDGIDSLNRRHDDVLLVWQHTFVCEYVLFM